MGQIENINTEISLEGAIALNDENKNKKIGDEILQNLGYILDDVEALKEKGIIR